MGDSEQPSKLPLFQPVPRPFSTVTVSTSFSTIISSPAYFPISCFFQVLSQLVLKPELHSPSILRADILSERSTLHHDLESAQYPSIEGFTPFRAVGRRLLPKQHRRDKPLLQQCLFYRSEDENEEGLGSCGIVEYICEVDKEEAVPYFHPKVKALRFCWSPPEGTADGTPEILGEISIQVSFFEGSTWDETKFLRLSSICNSVLLMIYKHGFGTLTGYKKRVNHDTIVPKNAYQDLYLSIKDKYSYLESQVPPEGKESKEDLKRHVWKDCAIATFLMLLWKDIYKNHTVDGLCQPPGGFVDLGCGNGMLVFILSSEGYKGYGVELRRRKTWAKYPEFIDLREEGINPTTLLQRCEDDANWSPFGEGTFLIGNHADELTPWIPVLASLTPGSAFLNIPCCLHTLSGRFVHTGKYIVPEDHLPIGQTQAEMEDGLSGGGRYKEFLIFLGGIGGYCGWKWEKESLRLPTTRAWSIIGRTRTSSDAFEQRIIRERVLSMIRDLRRVGFKVRKKEGKAGLLEEQQAQEEAARNHELEGVDFLSERLNLFDLLPEEVSV